MTTKQAIERRDPLEVALNVGLHELAFLRQKLWWKRTYGGAWATACMERLGRMGLLDEDGDLTKFARRVATAPVDIQAIAA